MSEEESGGFIDRCNLSVNDGGDLSLTPESLQCIIDNMIKDATVPRPHINLVSPRQMKGFRAVAEEFNISVDEAFYRIWMDQAAADVYLRAIK